MDEESRDCGVDDEITIIVRVTTESNECVAALD